MPEEVEIGEVGVDKVSEEAHEKAHEHGKREPWLRWLALSTAFFAVFAAVAALLAGHYSNEAILHMTESTLKQAQASDEWNFYQAKAIKGITREEEVEVLQASHADEAVIAKADSEAKRYDKEKDVEMDKAKDLVKDQGALLEDSKKDLQHHHDFAYVVTTLQVAIGLAAVAALIERKGVWYFALFAGVIGVAMFVVGALRLRGG